MTKEEIDQLIVDNMKIAYRITWDYYRRCQKMIEFDELLSVANLGLVKAANTYDMSKNFKFSTYAYKVIYNELAMNFRNVNKHKKYNISFISLEESIQDVTDNSIHIKDFLVDKTDLESTVLDNFELKSFYREVEKLDTISKNIILLYASRVKTG